MVTPQTPKGEGLLLKCRFLPFRGASGGEKVKIIRCSMDNVLNKQEISVDTKDRIKSFFIQYASQFRQEDQGYNEHIKLKQHHTAGVVKEISQLAEMLGFSREEIAFTEVIAWLHDIGRFEQYDTYSTFADAESENHAEIALRVIDKYNLLVDFSQDQIRIIKATILNHNQKQVPEREPEIIDFYSRLLRDADKLDIWQVMLRTNIFHTIKNEILPDTYSVPEKLLSYFKKHQTIPLVEVESFYDSILFRLSWVFDLNFECTLNQFKERKLTQKFLEKLPFSEDLEEIESSINNYKLELI